MIPYNSFESTYPSAKQRSSRYRFREDVHSGSFAVIRVKKTPSLNMNLLGVETRDETPSSFGIETPQRPSMRGRLCPFVSDEGVCKFMNECAYSHTIEEARRHNHHFKTKICEFAANGFCKKANTCRFAHSSSELSADVWDTRSCVLDQVPSTASTDATTPIKTPRGIYGTRDDDLSPISERSNTSIMSPTVCYVAPPRQRAVLHHRPHRQVLVPSSFHYVDQIEKRKACQPVSPSSSLVHARPHEMIFPYYTQQAGPAIVYGAPIVGYSMVMNNVLYED